MENCSLGQFDTIFTDIPYGAVNRESNGIRVLDKKDADITTFDLNLFLPLCEKVARNWCVIFCGKEQFSEIFSYFSKLPGTTRPLVWEKSNPSPMNGQHVYLSGVELAVAFKKRGTRVYNAHCKNTVFRHANGRSKFHPTEKNHRLIEEILLDISNENDHIFDPCMGSGSTGVVCRKLNRKFTGVEINPEFYQLAKARLE